MATSPAATRGGIQEAVQGATGAVSWTAVGGGWRSWLGWARGASCKEYGFPAIGKVAGELWSGTICRIGPPSRVEAAE